MRRFSFIVTTLLFACLTLPGCGSQTVTRGSPIDYPAVPVVRRHDEIVVAGTFVHTGWNSKVVLWFDPLGLDAYKGGGSTADARNFGVRFEKDPQLKNIPREEWSLIRLRDRVDQIVLHYDAVGDSRLCFNTLKRRGLSAHFLIDRDGTIYQTMDVRERAWHATTSNDRSVGIEIANMGEGKGIRGVINGRTVEMPPYTAAQDEALVALCSALCSTLPQIAVDYPKDAQGRVVPTKLDAGRLASFHGILGHWHVQANKVDPGPALDWEGLIQGIRGKMGLMP